MRADFPMHQLKIFTMFMYFIVPQSNHDIPHCCGQCRLEPHATPGSEPQEQALQGTRVSHVPPIYVRSIHTIVFMQELMGWAKIANGWGHNELVLLDVSDFVQDIQAQPWTFLRVELQQIYRPDVCAHSASTYQSLHFFAEDTHVYTANHRSHMVLRRSLWGGGLSSMHAPHRRIDSPSNIVFILFLACPISACG